MYDILIVEDSPMVLKVLKHVLADFPLFQPRYATTMTEAKALLTPPTDGSPIEVFAALVDLNLPDGPNGEIVEFMLEQGIPTIVLTGSFDEDKRSFLLSKGIVDYVAKEGRYSYEYAVGVLVRLVKNQNIKVLVVDDSEVARRFVCTLLKIHLYQVFEASDGVRAIKVLLDNPDIKLMITDFNMPRMDGCELVKNIRAKYEKTDLIIIGLSSEGERSLSARFIKSGANDFLRKPFFHEEFYCRLNQNVEMFELIGSIQDGARRDHLSGAYNQHYFKQHSAKVIADSIASKSVTSLAVLELEGIEQLVQHAGLDAGEAMLKQAAQAMMVLFDRFTFARAEAQKFFILLPGLSNDKAVAYVEKARQVFCARRFAYRGSSSSGELSLTYTAGVSSLSMSSVDAMIRNAELCLARAYDAGGDLVFGDE